VTDQEALALIRSARLSRLRRLGLAGTRIGTPTIEALCESDRFFRCGKLDLWRCDKAGELLAVLARSPRAAHLRVLLAGFSGCTDAQAKALAVSPCLKNLRKLDLSGCQIGPEGAETLTDPAAFPHLEELTLRNNPIADRGALALARWGQEHSQNGLLLRETQLTAAGVVELVRSGTLAGLVEIDLSDNAFGGEGVEALARSPGPWALRSLLLENVGLTDAGAALLAGLTHLPRELTLSVYDNPDLGDEALRALHDRFVKVYPSVH
jgi:Ran GTPase-activating protein (RanGAP) involved in mRNA processing and transport